MCTHKATIWYGTFIEKNVHDKKLHKFYLDVVDSRSGFFICFHKSIKLPQN